VIECTSNAGDARVNGCARRSGGRGPPAQPRRFAPESNMVSKMIGRTVVWIAAMAAVLFVSAGTARWPAA
jgi:hypothetical protein